MPDSKCSTAEPHPLYFESSSDADCSNIDEVHLRRSPPWWPMVNLQWVLLWNLTIAISNPQPILLVALSAVPSLVDLVFSSTSYCEILDDMQFCLTSTVVNISQMLVHP